MRTAPLSHGLPVVLAVVTIFFGGCLGRSENPRFYSLTPMQQDEGIPKRENPIKNAVIGIGPVKLADYLDQTMLITRTSDNQVKKAEFDRWVGSFKDNFTNVLADNIGSLLLTDRIYLYPWRVAVPIDYQVILDIVRCDGRLGDAAWLEVRWSIFGGPEKKLLKMSRSSIREPV
ncbi:MAG: membrane integrity-associated transporter subunit PqiC, partial [Deltaproteobacteria bacterium]|nr:membrane integrity-associated transporter subunit PqiC [Deltaproteobacteria bacterium]